MALTARGSPGQAPSANVLDFSRAAVGGSHVRALRGVSGPDDAPYDRDRAGGKHHLVTDASGIPLAVSLSGGDRSDVMQFVALLGAVPPVRGRRGRPRCRPGFVFGDCGDDHGKDCRLVCSFGVEPVIIRRGAGYGSGLGTQHWAVERACAHVHWFRRLRIGWETRDDVHEAFLTLGCALVGWRRSVSSL